MVFVPLFLMVLIFSEPEASAVVTFGTPTRAYSPEKSAERLEWLRSQFGQNKVIPKKYELPALVALSHFPELIKARVEFVVRDGGAPVASWPVIPSLIKLKRFWCYRVYISEGSQWGQSPALVRNMSFNAQVGALGHELAHTLHFHRKSLFGMIGMGVSFLSKKFHIRFERDTDKRAVDQGLGWQLYDWAAEIRAGRLRDNPDSWLDIYYLSPERIEAYMKITGGYESVDSSKP